MKHIHFLLFTAIMLVTIKSTAQLNYFFTATSKPYVPVTGGITPHLISDFSLWKVEDEGLATIPIGFIFNYDHANHTEVNISVNGFITLGDPFSTVYNFRYFENHLGMGPVSFPYERPVIAPLWDDLLLPDTLNLVYKTTGTAPFRVFTIEWKQVKWVYESLAPVLSIELKLYESTNIIEFDYKDEGGLPDPRYAFASIGITNAHTNRNFIAVQASSAHPDISMLKVNDSIAIKPADNQVYRFIPASTKIPAALQSSLIYTNNKAAFKLHAPGITDYEYTLTHSPIPPAAGIKTSSSGIAVSSLLPATTYYIYARSKGVNNSYSQWVSDSFTTAAKPVELPYTVNSEGTNYPLVPADIRTQDFMDTAFYYSPDYPAWEAFTDFFEAGDKVFLYYQTDFYNPDSWLYTSGLKLTAGKTYQLKFGYIPLYEYAPEDSASLEVKFGIATGEKAMTAGTLFKNTGINNAELKDTVIEFSPNCSGVYYVGFHDMSLFFQAFLVVSNISVTEKMALPEIPFALNGKTNGADNLLNWKIKNNQSTAALELQRSTDGINFTNIGSVPFQTLHQSKALKTQTNFRVQQNIIASNFTGYNNKNSEPFTKNGLGFELQKSTDGINFTNINAPDTNTNAKTNTSKNNYDYTDHNAKGMNYYRLQQRNKNGELIYSNVVKLEIKTNQISIYPDPAKDVLNVKIESANTNMMNIVVTDFSRRIWITKTVQLSQGINNIQLTIQSLPAGISFLKIINTDGSENAVRKFVKL